MKLAPILLFVYNRLWHTNQTIEALRKNTLSDQSDLIIFSDGPKSEAAQKPVQAVRDYIRTVNGFKSIRIFEQKTNKGLANSIINGVTDIVDKYGKIIVLEDDIITSPYFLKYMNDALEYYINIPQVMHIAGYMPPINTADLPQTFFLKLTTCWGWGTWKRAWKSFEKNSEKLIQEFTPELKREFNFNNSYDYFSHIIANHEKKIDTWAIFWYASVFFSNGLCLHPAQSVVENIGNDATGVHCKNTSNFDVSPTQFPVLDFANTTQQHQIATKRLIKFYKSLRNPLYKRLVNLAKFIATKRQS